MVPPTVIATRGRGSSLGPASLARPKRDAAPGVEGTTWRDYEKERELRLAALHDRVHSGAYRPEPSRRRSIPKPDGRQRPPRDKPVGRRLTAVAGLEDKIVQRAAVAVLTAIYEEDFSRVLLWVPTAARPARCVGRAGGGGSPAGRSTGSLMRISGRSSTR